MPWGTQQQLLPTEGTASGWQITESSARAGADGGKESGCVWMHAEAVKCQWLFSKGLTASDTNKLGRIILPRQAVEMFLPHVEDKAGLELPAWDTSGSIWTFKLKCAAVSLTAPACNLALHLLAMHTRTTAQACMVRRNKAEHDDGQKGLPWFVKSRYWMNGTNPKRMYVVENTRDFVRAHDLRQGSILSFYYAEDGRLVGTAFCSTAVKVTILYTVQAE
jgi:hypothetical protein